MSRSLRKAASVGLHQLVGDPGGIIRLQGTGYGTLRLIGNAHPDLSLDGTYAVTYCVQSCICSDGQTLPSTCPSRRKVPRSWP